MRRLLIGQSGSSMVEMLGVLTIIGMVGMGTIKFIGGVHNVFAQNMIVNEARDLQKSISDRFRFNGNYEELFNGRGCEGEDTVAAYICNNKLAPFQMCSDGKLHHHSGGDVKICRYESSPNEPDDTKYVMIFYSLSDTACSSMAQVNWYTRQKSDVYQMVINGNVEGKTTIIDSHYIPGDHGDNIFPVSASKASSACNNDNDNTIQLVFF